MKVFSITALCCEVIEIEDSSHAPYSTFRRYGPDNWDVQMGESLETVHNCADLEAAYQVARMARDGETDAVTEMKVRDQFGDWASGEFLPPNRNYIDDSLI